MKLKGKLTYVAVVTLAVQALAAVAGVDVAPAEVDALLVAVNTAIAIYARWRATRTA